VGVEPHIEVDGLAEVRRALKAAKGSTKDLRQAHRRVAKVAETGSRRDARSGIPQQRRAAKVLLAKGSTQGADLAIRNTSAVPFGLGAFLGGHRPQFPPWVGNRWDVLAGDGPYVIAEAIQRDRDDILAAFDEEMGQLLEAAGLPVEAAPIRH
jgi:hypothetical protein